MSAVVPYTAELAEDILEQISSNTMALHELCEQPGWPTLRQLHKWMREIPEFRAHVDNAFRARADILVEEGLEELKDLDTQTLERLGKTANAAVARARALFEANIKVAKRFSPDWQEKSQHIVRGDEDNPVQIDLSGLSVDQLRQLKNLSGKVRTTKVTDVPYKEVNGSAQEAG